MKDVKITCDNCGDDLAETGAMPKYRLALSSEAVESEDGSMYAVIVHPPTSRDHHFCDLGCLKEWVNKT